MIRNYAPLNTAVGVELSHYLCPRACCFCGEQYTDDFALSKSLLDTDGSQFGCGDCGYSVSCSVSGARTSPLLLVRDSSCCGWRGYTDCSKALPSTFRIFVVLIVLLLTGWRIRRGLNAFLLCPVFACSFRFASITTGIPGFSIWRLFFSTFCVLLRWYAIGFWHRITP